MIYNDPKPDYSVLDLGFNRFLTKNLLSSNLIETTPEMSNVITSGIAPKSLTSGELISEFEQKAGTLFSGKTGFTNTETGYRLGIDSSDNLAKFYIGNTTSYINWDGSTLTVTGGLTVDSLDIPNTTTADSFHVDSEGNTWWGATTLGASVVVDIGALNVAARGWTQTSVFSSTDSETVAWAAGTFTSADGTAYSIGANNTGVMTVATYIYLDIAVSTTEYQTTATAATAVGAGKVLIAKAQNNSGGDQATFQVFGGIGGQMIDGEDIVARSITAGEIAANTITANELSTSLLYAGSIEVDVSGNMRSGQTDYNTGDGWWLGNHFGTPKFSIGSTTVAYSTIAFDAVSNGGEDTSVSSSTHSHTCTGSDLTLFVLVSIRYTTDADRIVTSVTYDGVACSKIRSDDNTDIRRTEIWALQSPSTGANDIVVTMTGTCTAINVVGLSLTGTGSIVTSNGVSQGGNTTSASVSMTSLIDGSWTVGILSTSASGNTYVEGTGQTNRYALAGTNLDTQVSTETITTAGAAPMSWTWTTNAWRAMTAVVIQPKETITPQGNGLTWDGVTLDIQGAQKLSKTFTAGEATTGATTPQPVFITAANTLDAFASAGTGAPASQIRLDADPTGFAWSIAYTFPLVYGVRFNARVSGGSPTSFTICIYERTGSEPNYTMT